MLKLGLFLKLADWSYLKSEEIKKYLAIKSLEQARDLDIALLGETIFKIHPDGLSLIQTDPTVSRLTNKIASDEAKILRIKNTNLTS